MNIDGSPYNTDWTKRASRRTVESVIARVESMSMPQLEWFVQTRLFEESGRDVRDTVVRRLAALEAK